MNRDWRNALIGLAILVVGVGGFFVYQNYFKAAAPDDGQVAGTTEGDFSNVPDGTPETQDFKVGETKSIFGVKINPTEIVDDSRCPEGVQCIQAGTVRVSAMVTPRGESTASPVMFELGVPMTVGMDQITLIKVMPDKKEGAEIAPNDYVLTFTVVKGGGFEYFKG